MLKDKINDRMLAEEEVLDILSKYETNVKEFVEQLRECFNGKFFATKEENLKTIINTFFYLCGESIEKNIESLKNVSFPNEIYGTKCQHYYNNVDYLKKQCDSITSDVLRSKNPTLVQTISVMNLDHLKRRFDDFENLFYDKLGAIDYGNMQFYVHEIKHYKDKFQQKKDLVYDVYGNGDTYTMADMILNDDEISESISRIHQYEYHAKELLRHLVNTEQKRQYTVYFDENKDEKLIDVMDYER